LVFCVVGEGFVASFEICAVALPEPGTGSPTVATVDSRLLLPALLTASVAVLGGCAPGAHGNENAARRKQVAAEAAQLPAATIGRQLDTQDGSPAGTIVVKHTAFTPATFTITAGQALLWSFDDGGVAHTVTGDGFDSGPKPTGIFSHTFATPGAFAYHCSIHAAMKGSVTVTRT
jgi:plastocyanin